VVLEVPRSALEVPQNLQGLVYVSHGVVGVDLKPDFLIAFGYHRVR